MRIWLWDDEWWGGCWWWWWWWCDDDDDGDDGDDVLKLMRRWWEENEKMMMMMRWWDDEMMRWWEDDDKMMMRRRMRRRKEEEEAAEAAGWRQKNKNPARQCGEKRSVSQLSYFFAHLHLLSSDFLYLWSSPFLIFSILSLELLPGCALSICPYCRKLSFHTSLD